MKKIISAILMGVFLAGLLPFPGTAANENAPVELRDIPGVTEEEIQAVRQLSDSEGPIIYGMVESYEAFRRDDGTIGGFVALFCEYLGELFDMEFMPQVYAWDELVHHMDNGTVALSSDFRTDSGHADRYIMSKTIHSRVNRLLRLRDGESFANPLTYQGLDRKPRFVFLQGTDHYDLLNRLIPGAFTAVFADNHEEIINILRSGEADGLLVEDVDELVTISSPDLVMEDFYPVIYEPVSLVTADRRFEVIIQAVDRLLDTQEGQQLIQTLYSEGYAEYQRHVLFTTLTGEERDYIDAMAASGAAVTVMMEADNYPACFYNENEGEYQGIAVDVLAQISDLTGLTFVQKTDLTEWAPMLEAFNRGEADMITELVRSPDREDQYAWTDSAYTVDQYALLARSETPSATLSDLADARIALIDDSVYMEMFYLWFPDHNNVEIYPSNEAAFIALEDGEVDMVMASRYMLLNFTNFKEMPAFHTCMLFDSVHESRFGIQKDLPVLAGIIDKAQGLIDSEHITADWTNKVFDYRVKMYQMRTPYLVASIVLMVALLGLAVLFLVRHHNTNLRLESLVKDRTHELEIQTDAAQAASRAKSDFLARMSHEIRTPLNAIMGMTTIGQSAKDPEKKQYCLSQIDCASQQLLGIVNDVLDLSKIEANKLAVEKSAMDLEHMLANVANAIQFRAEEKQQDFLVHIDRGIPGKIMGDELRLSQVTTNLLDNAVKFTPEGGAVHLYVTAEKLQKHNWYTLRVAVRDNGIGISQEDQKKLFQSFEQADGGISRKFGGTGLGLAISKNLMELMGGSIEMVSALGSGSTFTFTLDCECVEALPGQSLHAQVGKGKLRALVVERSAENRAHFVAMMDGLGIACDAAADGPAAWGLLAGEAGGRPYAVAFIDRQVGDMDSCALTKRIKEISSDTAVILISPASQAGEDGRVEDTGIAGVISRPLFPSKLANAMNKCVGLAAPPEKAVQQGASSGFRGKAILLAEDIPINREIVKSYLEDTAIVFDEAENGAEAVQKFCQHPQRYDLILMDIHMPEMDGFEATQKIRQAKAPNAKSIPIIAMTANVFQEDIDRYLANGMNDHIGKPVKKSKLYETIKKYL